MYGYLINEKKCYVLYIIWLSIIFSKPFGVDMVWDLVHPKTTSDLSKVFCIFYQQK